MQLVLQLTRDCNFACEYCYQAHRKGPGMPAAIAQRSVQWLLDEGHNHVAVTFFGGEPLLHREAVEALWPALRAMGEQRGALVTAKICTNGVLLDESFARFARKTALFVSLSIDGGPASQDAGRRAVDGSPTSDLAERALAALVAARTPFATYSVVTPANVRHFAESADWLFERRARTLVSTLDFGAEWKPAALDALATAYHGLAERYVRWTRAGERFFLAPFDSKIAGRTQADAYRSGSCRAGARQVAVDPEGFIYPCIEFLESPEFRIGHVDSGLDRAQLRALNHDHGGSRPEVCGDCAISDRCGSTCACLNLRVAGGIRSIDPLLCAHERLVTELSDRIAAKLYRQRSREFLDRQYNPWHGPLHVLESLLAEEKR